MLDLRVGRALIKCARKAIEDPDFEAPSVPKEFKLKRGVFVTLYSFPDHDLRGCIGIPQPVMSLGRAVVSAARSSAFSDPRFNSLSLDDLGKTVIEVSVLSKPLLIKAEKPGDYVKKIKVGRDGLIIEAGFTAGLLLPQVAVEYDWSAETFLNQVCIKAGLSPDCWREDKLRIYKFRAEIFKEQTPKGKVIKESFKK